MREDIAPPAPAEPARTPPYAPRFWPTWFGLGLMRLLAFLPFRVQTAVGRGLGRLIRPLLKREQRIARINLQLCFPDWTDARREHLMRQHFEALGCALFDTANAWWASHETILRRTRVEGMEHLDAALAGGRGVLLLAAHFTPIEMGARILTARTPAAVMYQPPRDSALDASFRACRGARDVLKIPSNRVRELLQALKRNLTVWIAPDQLELGRTDVLAPFFGQPVLCASAPARIARLSGAPVLPYFVERLEDGSGYRARIDAPLADFPSGDAQSDAARMQALIESDARRCPAQYLWTYKRFRYPGHDPYRRGT